MKFKPSHLAGLGMILVCCVCRPVIIFNSNQDQRSLRLMVIVRLLGCYIYLRQLHLLLFADKTTVNHDRPEVRLFSKKARDYFSHKLNLCDWSDIYAVKDVNRASEIFFDRIAIQFNESFPHVRLPRKRASDKKMDNERLEKSL